MLRRLALLSLCAVLATTAVAAPSGGPTLQQIESQQAARERDRDIARAELEAAKTDLAQLQAQLNEFDIAQQSGERAVSGKRLRLAALNAQEAELKARLGGAQAELATLLSLLALIRRDPPPALFVRPDRVRDAVRAAILVRAITLELNRRAEALSLDLTRLQQVRRAAASTSEDLFTTESAVAERRAQIESLAAQKVALERQDEAEAGAASQDAEQLAARARALRNAARGLAAAPSPPAEPEPPDPEHGGPLGGREAFTAPVPGPPSRRFGEQEPNGGPMSLGWTWRIDHSAPIVAPATGVIEYAGPLKGWGVVLILRLGGGYHLVLAGLETALVGPGRMVKAGETVGRMAVAGGASSEFYLEIRKNGAPIDPARWLAPLRGLRH